MDKYEYKVRAEEIKTLISQKKYADAARVADTIDWTRVKSVMMLCTVSDVYKVNRRFDDAKLLLEMANERHPSGRMILYSLCDLAIRMGDVVGAVEYYKDFEQVAPNDSGKYVLQYKLYEAQDVGLEERIAVLEELKKKDYREKWAYELAYLYHRVGLATKCVEECDELILWFGEGKYVMKAMELKTLHQPLTPSQQKKFDAYMMRRQGLRVPEEPEKDAASGAAQKRTASGGQEMDIRVKTMDVGKYNTLNLQKELAASMKELMHEGRAAAASGQAPMGQEAAEQAYAGPDRTERAYAELGRTEQRFPEQAYAGPETAAVEPPLPEMEEASSQMNYDNYLAQEYDGQISMVVPEEQPVEKQITGQMKLDDIMRSWEKVKRENEEKHRQEIQQRIQKQTGDLFRDFDETSRRGVLERLQKEERIPVDRRERSRETENVISAHTKIWAAGEVQNAVRAAAAAAAAQERASLAEEPSAAVRAQNDADGQPAAGREQMPAAEVSPASMPMEKTPAAEQSVAAAGVPERVPVAEQPVAAAGVPERVPVAEQSAAEMPEKVPVTEQPAAAALPEERREQPAERRRMPEQAEAGRREKEAPDAPDAPQRQTAERKPQKTARPAGRRKADAAPGERALTGTEKRLFASFVPTKGAMKRLVCALDQISLASCTGNLILTGEPGSDTLTLAKNVVKDLKAKEPDFTGKAAKVTGNALNGSRKSLSGLVEKLDGGVLMVERAGELDEKCAGRLMQALNQEGCALLVILMDTKHRIRRLLEENPEMASFFNARFDVEALDNSTLVAYGCQYARMQEYAVDELGRLALHTRIEDMQTSDHIVTVADVREIVDEAIDHAERKTPKHLIDVLLSRRYDENDMIILHEGDFI